ncbi:MAG: hypothetical protein M3R13_03315 [Armatimonadota bacterium]|nr:hypothetical protein [Armatimonadota bacterium]
MPKPTLLFIRGDTEGAFGAIKFYWPFFYVSRLTENPGYEPSTLLTPTVEEAIDALADADAAIFYGHGNSGKVWLKANRKAAFDVAGVLELARLRKLRNRDPMHFVHVACCETCKDAAWVDAWLEVTRVLRGYEVDTYDPKSPFSVPDCKTYIKVSQPAK